MPNKNSKSVGVATEGQTGVATLVSPPRVRLLPMFRVILHNDDHNFIEHVVETIVMLTPLKTQEAVERAVEANDSGTALILVTHRERAELYEEQFRSRSLVVTIEPAE